MAELTEQESSVELPEGVGLYNEFPNTALNYWLNESCPIVVYLIKGRLYVPVGVSNQKTKSSQVSLTVKNAMIQVGSQTVLKVKEIGSYQLQNAGQSILKCTYVKLAERGLMIPEFTWGLFGCAFLNFTLSATHLPTVVVDSGIKNRIAEEFINFCFTQDNIYVRQIKQWLLDTPLDPEDTSVQSHVRACRQIPTSVRVKLLNHQVDDEVISYWAESEDPSKAHDGAVCNLSRMITVKYDLTQVEALFRRVQAELHHRMGHDVCNVLNLIIIDQMSWESGHTWKTLCRLKGLVAEIVVADELGIELKIAEDEKEEVKTVAGEFIFRPDLKDGLDLYEVTWSREVEYYHQQCLVKIEKLKQSDMNYRFHCVHFNGHFGNSYGAARDTFPHGLRHQNKVLMRMTANLMKVAYEQLPREVAMSHKFDIKQKPFGHKRDVPVVSCTEQTVRCALNQVRERSRILRDVDTYEIAMGIGEFSHWQDGEEQDEWCPKLLQYLRENRPEVLKSDRMLVTQSIERDYKLWVAAIKTQFAKVNPKSRMDHRNHNCRVIPFPRSLNFKVDKAFHMPSPRDRCTTLLLHLGSKGRKLRNEVRALQSAISDLIGTSIRFDETGKGKFYRGKRLFRTHVSTPRGLNCLPGIRKISVEQSHKFKAIVNKILLKSCATSCETCVTIKNHFFTLEFPVDPEWESCIFHLLNRSLTINNEQVNEKYVKPLAFCDAKDRNKFHQQRKAYKKEMKTDADADRRLQWCDYCVDDIEGIWTVLLEGQHYHIPDYINELPDFELDAPSELAASDLTNDIWTQFVMSPLGRHVLFWYDLGVAFNKLSVQKKLAGDFMIIDFKWFNAQLLVCTPRRFQPEKRSYTCWILTPTKYCNVDFVKGVGNFYPISSRYSASNCFLLNTRFTTNLLALPTYMMISLAHTHEQASRSHLCPTETCHITDAEYKMAVKIAILALRNKKTDSAIMQDSRYLMMHMMSEVWHKKSPAKMIAECSDTFQAYLVNLLVQRLDVHDCQAHVLYPNTESKFMKTPCFSWLEPSLRYKNPLMMVLDCYHAHVFEKSLEQNGPNIIKCFNKIMESHDKHQRAIDQSVINAENGDMWLQWGLRGFTDEPKNIEKEGELCLKIIRGDLHPMCFSIGGQMSGLWLQKNQIPTEKLIPPRVSSDPSDVSNTSSVCSKVIRQVDIKKVLEKQQLLNEIRRTNAVRGVGLMDVPAEVEEEYQRQIAGASDNLRKPIVTVDDCLAQLEKLVDPLDQQLLFLLNKFKSKFYKHREKLQEWATDQLASLSDSWDDYIATGRMDASNAWTHSLAAQIPIKALVVSLFQKGYKQATHNLRLDIEQIFQDNGINENLVLSLVTDVDPEASRLYEQYVESGWDPDRDNVFEVLIGMSAVHVHEMAQLGTVKVEMMPDKIFEELSQPIDIKKSNFYASPLPKTQRSKNVLYISKYLLNCSKYAERTAEFIMSRIGLQSMLSIEIMYYGMAPKPQIGGVREIPVMSFITKVANHMLERVSEVIARYLKGDTVVNGHKKHYYMTELLNWIKEDARMKRYMNSDCSKWGPEKTPFQFIGVLAPFMRFFPKEIGIALRVHLMKASVKDLEIPHEVLTQWMKTDWDYQRMPAHVQEAYIAFIKFGWMVICNECNMGQGMMHITSTLCQASCTSLAEYIYPEIAFKKVFSSDDSICAVFCENRMQLSEINDKLHAVARICSNQESPKSTCGILGEYNSEFFCNQSQLISALKFAYPMAQNLVQANHVDTMRAMVSQASQCVKNSGSYFLTLSACRSMIWTIETSFDQKFDRQLPVLLFGLPTFSRNLLFSVRLDDEDILRTRLLSELFGDKFEKQIDFVMQHCQHSYEDNTPGRFTVKKTGYRWPYPTLDWAIDESSSVRLKQLDGLRNDMRAYLKDNLSDEEEFLRVLMPYIPGQTFLSCASRMEQALFSKNVEYGVLGNDKHLQRFRYHVFTHAIAIKDYKTSRELKKRVKLTLNEFKAKMLQWNDNRVYQSETAYVHDADSILQLKDIFDQSCTISITNVLPKFVFRAVHLTSGLIMPVRNLFQCLCLTKFPELINLLHPDTDFDATTMELASYLLNIDYLKRLFGSIQAGNTGGADRKLASFCTYIQNVNESHRLEMFIVGNNEMSHTEALNAHVQSNTAAHWFCHGRPDKSTYQLKKLRPLHSFSRILSGLCRLSSICGRETFPSFARSLLQDSEVQKTLHLEDHERDLIQRAYEIVQDRTSYALDTRLAAKLIFGFAVKPSDFIDFKSSKWSPILRNLIPSINSLVVTYISNREAASICVNVAKQLMLICNIKCGAVTIQNALIMAVRDSSIFVQLKQHPDVIKALICSDLQCSCSSRGWKVIERHPYLHVKRVAEPVDSEMPNYHLRMRYVDLKSSEFPIISKSKHDELYCETIKGGAEIVVRTINVMNNDSQTIIHVPTSTMLPKELISILVKKITETPHMSTRNMIFVSSELTKCSSARRWVIKKKAFWEWHQKRIDEDFRLHIHDSGRTNRFFHLLHHPEKLKGEHDKSVRRLVKLAQGQEVGPNFGQFVRQHERPLQMMDDIVNPRTIFYEKGMLSSRLEVAGGAFTHMVQNPICGSILMSQIVNNPCDLLFQLIMRAKTLKKLQSEHVLYCKWHNQLITQTLAQASSELDNLFLVLSTGLSEKEHFPHYQWSTSWGQFSLTIRSHDQKVVQLSVLWAPDKIHKFKNASKHPNKRFWSLAAKALEYSCIYDRKFPFEHDNIFIQHDLNHRFFHNNKEIWALLMCNKIIELDERLSPACYLDDAEEADDSSVSSETEATQTSEEERNSTQISEVETVSHYSSDTDET
jgi:hypothetical protein